MDVQLRACEISSSTKINHNKTSYHGSDSGLPRKKFEADFCQLTPEEEHAERVYWQSQFTQLLEFGDFERLASKRRGRAKDEDDWSCVENSSLSSADAESKARLLQLEEDEQDEDITDANENENENEKEDEMERGETPRLDKLNVNASTTLENLIFNDGETTDKIIETLQQNIDDHSHHHGLSPLKSLEIFNSEVTEEFINFALKHRWDLEHLKIGFAPGVSILKIRAFLTHLRHTLTSLDLTYNGTEDFDENACPIQDNWVIPLSLRELASLEISVSQNHPHFDANSCRFLINALQLPNLKRCKFSSPLSWDENYFESVWNSPLDGVKSSRRGSEEKGHRERCPWRSKEPTLEVFELPGGCHDPTIFLQEPNPWRNLKELICHSPSVKVIQVIFLYLPCLERLEIDGLEGTSHILWDALMTDALSRRDELTGRPIIWDEVFTGKKKPVYSILYKMRAEPLVKESTAPLISSICNLSRLKSLKLNFEPLLEHEKLSDFFICQALVNLKHLEHLQINQHTFSNAAIEHLHQFGNPKLELDWGENLDMA